MRRDSDSGNGNVSGRTDVRKRGDGKGTVTTGRPAARRKRRKGIYTMKWSGSGRGVWDSRRGRCVIVIRSPCRLGESDWVGFIHLVGEKSDNSAEGEMSGVLEITRVEEGCDRSLGPPEDRRVSDESFREENDLRGENGLGGGIDRDPESIHFVF